MPVDVRVGKMLIMSAVLRCVDPVLTIAAALSNKSPFSSHPYKKGIRALLQPLITQKLVVVAVR
jgi:HrpA-like RNA helicase